MATVPLGRCSTPADIANGVCYLASDEAAFITGVNLEVRILLVHPPPPKRLYQTNAHCFRSMVVDAYKHRACLCESIA